MVEQKLPKLTTRVRFPSPAPVKNIALSQLALTALELAASGRKYMFSPSNRNALALLALVLAAQSPLTHAAPNLEAGKAAFKKCASCHAVGPSAHSGFGPQLNGIVGRRAGGATDYKYSPAMTNSGIVWTDKTLSAFLRDPGDVVPGTKMRFWGISDQQQIDNLLAYLRTFK
jgi:cytochrome c